MLYYFFNNLLYTIWKHTARHPGSNWSSSIKCSALRKIRIASQAYDTSTNSLQLFVTQEILETKMSSVYSSGLNAILIHQLVQPPFTPTWMFGIHSPLWRGALQLPSPLSALPLADFIWCSQLFYWKESSQSVNPCSFSSHNSGFHIWLCSWLKSSNLSFVSHKEAMPYFWSSSLLFMNLCPVIFILRGGEGTAQSWRHGCTIAHALRIFSTY